MNKKLFKFELLGFLFVCVIGTLSHFFYHWSNESKFVALFSPVNESPWEHLKMLFFPFLIVTIFTAIKMMQSKFNIFFAGYVSIILGMWSTLSYFYTFNGIIGGNNEWVNLSSFFIGVLIAFIINYILIDKSIGKGSLNGFGITMFFVSSVIFILFTFEPPLLPLFQDPIKFTFGI